jgi:hypothetical protein
MPFVQRTGGTVVAMFARPQANASEWLAEDNAEVLAFRTAVADPRIPCTPLYCAREILTANELAALLTAAEGSIPLQAFLFQFGAAQYILPADPALSDGLTALVQLGLFTSQRRTAILAAVAAGMPSSWGQPA